MTPYYCDAASGTTIYHGDCRDVLPLIDADVLVTDPPYGVNIGGPDIGKNGSGARHGLAKARYDVYEDTYENFLAVVVPGVGMALERVRRGAIFSGPHLQDMPKAQAIGGVYCPAGSGRHAWGFKTFLPVLFYGKDPLLYWGARPNVLVSTAVADKIGPTPKPLEWMRWLVGFTSTPDETIIDPFAGSGTTLRAAKDLGRRAIGIEISERYCELAAKRLAQGVLPFSAVAAD
jgi:site-specific DNA-methyltransferase (adenine-specific)